MRMRMSRWLGATVVVAVLLGMMVAIPVWAAPSKQSDGAAPDASTAMHEACEAGDVQGMRDAMNSLTEEDRQAMGEHMASDHHGAMGSGMMGMGGMMGGWSGQGMMGWGWR